MKKKIVQLGFVALVVLIFAIPTARANHSHGEFGYGHHEGFSGGRMDEKFFHKMYFILQHEEELALTEKQTEAIQNLAHEVKKNAIKQGAEIEVLELGIAHELHGDSANLEVINKLVDQKYELKKSKEKGLAEAIVKLKQNLSEEQYKKMKALFK